jgi:DNA polymerase-1
MLRVAASLRASELSSRLLLQVHDELVLEVAHGETEEVRDIVIEQMGAAADLSVPLAVSIGIGRSWYDAAH